ncbi:MAG: hypothetical protein ABSD29_10155 [Verrucomicrobiota bacterium]
MNTNKNISLKQRARLALVLLALPIAPGLCPTARAYPPGPYHVLYGTVRDQYGTPLSSAQAQIVLQTPAGLQFCAPVVPGISIPGVNYLLRVPLDSGVTPDLYQPNVLVPAAPFKLVVVIGTVTNLPIQMTGTNFALGSWAMSTRVDLTLGVDSNGDGLPDAWEYAFLAAIGATNTLASLHANSVLTPDGLTLAQEFLLGTAVFDPDDPLKITFLGFNGASPVLQFPTLSGRSYTVRMSTNLKNWSLAAFNLASDAPDAPARSVCIAPSTAIIQVYVAPPPAGTTKQFYQIQVQ